MGVPAFGKSQSVEEVHRLVFAAVRHRRPIAAVYDGARRLLCPHVLGYNQPVSIECSVISTEEGAEADHSRRPVRESGAVCR
jgi:hypothetical protein